MSFSLREAAVDRPHDDALVVDGDAWSYGQLAERVGRTMAALLGRPELGASPPSGRTPRVALLADASPDSVLALLALVELGREVVLLHPRASATERQSLVNLTRPAVVLDAAGLRQLALTAAATAPPSLTAAPPIPDDDRPLAVLSTSGTTFAPRAVSLSRSAFAWAAEASARNLGAAPGERWLLALPFAHVGGLAVILRSLRGRGAVVLSTASPSPASSPGALHAVLRRDRVTAVSLVPTQLGRLLDTASLPPAPRLRTILLGGAPASAALLERADDRGLPVLTTYGMTETCAQVATQRPGTRNRGQLGCGPPLPGVEVRLGADGQIALRAGSLLSGYLEPGGLRGALDGDGFLVTRDAGRLDADGNLHILGRLDDVILSGGEKVHPLEVETALGSAVGGACVFGVADREWGARVAAALVAAPGGPVDDPALSAALAGLAGYKHPRAIAWLEALPLLASGKVDRRAVAALAGPRLRGFPGG